ncbi:hypothetical protein FPOAC2_07567 [Fusarium poae]
MMADIYSVATSVLMWIGEERDDSDLAFESIPTLSRAIEEAQTSETFSAIPFDKANKDLLLRILELKDPNVIQRSQKAWAKLHGRCYFKRAWIFQEVILAGSRGTVICGTQQCSWDAFQAAFQVYDATLKINRLPPLKTIILNDFVFRFTGSLVLNIALRTMSAFEAGDPRDKVFAALGLGFMNREEIQGCEHVQLPRAERVEIPRADYTKSVEQVFINANRYIIYEFGDKDLWRNLDPFNQTVAAEGTRSLPSWAFDFSKPARTHDAAFNTEKPEYGAMLHGSPTTTQTSLHING